MYILLDHVGDTVYTLGEKPLEACLKFCDYTKHCLPNDGLYPPGCARHAFEIFRWCVADGTASELFELVRLTSNRMMVGTNYPAIFEVDVVPRPACRECNHWKGDGAFCERGEREQSSDEPACCLWFPLRIEWKNARMLRKPMPRDAGPFTEFDRENLQCLLIEFLERKGGVATVREIKRRFKRSDVQNALDTLVAEGRIVKARESVRRGRPRVLYRLKDAEPSS